MTTWAITPRGIGRPVGARAIRKGWPLSEGEAFTVEAENPSEFVLAEGGASVRAGTEQELKPASEIRTANFYADSQRAVLLERLQNATPQQIETYITQNVTDLASARAMLVRVAKVLALNVAR